MNKNNNNNNNNTNNRSIFLCFRPVVVEEKSLNHHDHLHKVLAYIKIGEQQQQQQVCCDQELEMEIPPMVDDRDKMSPKSTKPKKMKAWLLRGGHRRRSAHRIISKIAKAMLFDSKLTKRIRSGKVRQDPNRQIEETNSSSSSKSSRFIIAIDFLEILIISHHSHYFAFFESLLFFVFIIVDNIEFFSVIRTKSNCRIEAD
ncbi:hypothetical protein Syun_010439 [Stephania yunnanensis]|uniref:Uncharacterized protein n=1 Tax=Stephania yunnanensis TaxID=152371 RepID=A0AAP0KJ38_9MAGN